MLKATIKIVNDVETIGDFTQEFNTILNANAKYTSCQVIYMVGQQRIVYDNYELNSLNIWYEGSLLSSVLKVAEIEFDSVLQNLKDRVYDDIRIGVSADDITYYYVSMGKFTVIESENNLENNTTKVTCYDELGKSMKPYGSIGESIDYTTPMSNLDYLELICQKTGITFSRSDFVEYAVMGLMRNAETYNEEYTYRDVLDDFAEILGGCLSIKNNKLSLVLPSQSEYGDVFLITQNDKFIITQDEDKILVRAKVRDIIKVNADQIESITIKEALNEVSNIVLSRAPQNDNAVLTTGTGETIKIINNLLVEGYQVDEIADRTPYLQPILYNIKNWGKFYSMELESFGYILFEPGDRVVVTIKDINGNLIEYPVIWSYASITVSPAIKESVESKLPIEQEVIYTKSNSETQKELATYIYVDKADQKITAKVDDNAGQISKIIQDASGLTGYFSSADGARYIKMSSEGIRISETPNSSYVLINEDGVDFYNDDQIRVASMRENEFDTTNWIYSETRFGNCLNIYKRRL